MVTTEPLVDSTDIIKHTKKQLIKNVDNILTVVSETKRSHC